MLLSIVTVTRNAAGTVARAADYLGRPLPDGVEYLFTAVDTPRPDAPQGMPAREMKVYVTVKDGAEPVFTQVVR